MKKIFLFLILNSTFLNLKSFAQAPDWLWAKAMGGVADNHGNSIAIDASGNVYTTGNFSSTVDFDPGAGVFNLTSAGSPDIFISKLDGSGNFIWAKAMGGVNTDEARSIALDPTENGDIYITGTFQLTADFDPGPGTFNLVSAGSLDIFISKLDSSGNFKWAKALSGTNVEEGFSLAVDPAGSGAVFITGSFLGTVDFDPGTGTFNLTSAGADDIFICKLDSSGNFAWAKHIGGTGNDDCYSIAIDPAGNGNIYTTGRFFGITDFDPGTGVFNLTSAGGSDIDIFISKLDSSGNFVWAKAIGGIGGNDLGYSIAVDTAGNADVYLTGFFEGTVDFDPGVGIFNLTSTGGREIFVSKLDSSGNFIWAKAMNGIGYFDQGTSIVLDPAGSGDVYAIGSFEATVDFDPGGGVFNLTSAGSIDIFISKLNSSGNFAWAKAVGGTNDDTGNSITLNSSGNVYVTGYFFSSTISFGSTTLTNTGSSIFIAKLDNVITGIESAENNDGGSVYPNPATNKIIVQSLQFKVESVEVYDVVGVKVIALTPNPSPSGEGSASIDVSELARGIYFVKVRGENRQSVAKFVKQ